jgi:hypothetical protein
MAVDQALAVTVPIVISVFVAPPLVGLVCFFQVKLGDAI